MHVGNWVLLNIWPLMAVFKVGTSFLQTGILNIFKGSAFILFRKPVFKIQALKYISFSFCSLGDQSLLVMNCTGNYSLQFPTQFYQHACILTRGLGSSLFFIPHQSLVSLLSYQEADFLMHYHQLVTKLKQLNSSAQVLYDNDFRLSSESLQNPLTTLNWSVLLKITSKSVVGWLIGLRLPL